MTDATSSPDPFSRTRAGGRDHWQRGDYPREELARALVAGRVAGPETSHDRANVRMKIGRLVAGDPEAQFGLTGLDPFSELDVLALMAEASGFDPDPDLRQGPSAIDPDLVLDACEDAGDRLAAAAARGAGVLLATGHPVGLPLLYIAVGALLDEYGAKLLRPLDGVRWSTTGWDGRRRRRQIRYLHGVGVVTEHGSAIHTHDAEPMERILEEVRPDLVFADHGLAGAAIEAGIETISIADVNDPPPVLARAQGRTQVVIVMDDNVRPEDYWPCFQAIASRFPG